MKAQLGVRVNRIVYRQFVELCRKENLRPGEALEAMIAGAIRAGSVIVLASNPGTLDARARRVDELRFCSMHDRLEKYLAADEKLFEATGKDDAVGRVHSLIHDLYDLAPRIQDERLVDRFQKLVERSDRLDTRLRDARVEESIKESKEELEELDEPDGDE